MKRGGSYSLMNASTSANITIKNSAFRDSVFNLVSASELRALLIDNCTFKNLSNIDFEPCFICIKSIPTEGNYSYLVQDSKFIDIVVRHTLILLRENVLPFIAKRISMKNISNSATTLSLTDIYVLGEGPIGLCGSARVSSGFVIEESNFTNINGNCLGLDVGRFDITSSTFDNSELKAEEVKIDRNSLDKLDDYSGISWININNGDPASILTLKKNKFIKNNRLSKYGGV